MENETRNETRLSHPTKRRLSGAPGRLYRLQSPPPKADSPPLSPGVGDIVGSVRIPSSLLPCTAPDPLAPCVFAQLAGGGPEDHRGFFGLAARQLPAVQVEEDHHRRQRDALVAIHEGMVAQQSPAIGC